MNNLFRSIGYALKKNSPKILTVVGTGLVIGGTVLACKSTLKANEIIAKSQDDLDKVNDVNERNIPEYTEQDYKKDILTVYTQTGLELAKIYAPAIMCEVIGLGCFFGSHHILSKRNVALTAAYSGLSKTYNNYRSKVTDILGEDKEFELVSGAKEIEETDDNGKVVAKTISKYEDTLCPCKLKFDCRSANWRPDKGEIKFYLQQAETEFNKQLGNKGIKVINDICRMIDLPETAEGQILGWIKKPGEVRKISFGLDHFEELYDPIDKSFTIMLYPDGNVTDLDWGEYYRFFKH